MSKARSRLFLSSVAAITLVLGLLPGAAEAQEVCPPTGSFSDDFEPTAMVGWTVDSNVNLNPMSANWTVVMDPAAHSLTNEFSSDASGLDEKDDRLVSPPQDLSTTSQLIFWHRFAFERFERAGEFDGGVLEVSTDGGTTWVDVGESNFVAGGYSHTISSGFGSRIGGRRAWAKASPAFPNAMNEVRVNLGSFAGADRLIRWRNVLDPLAPGSEPGVEWSVDDVQFTNLVINCPPVAVDDTATTANGNPVVIPVLANDTDANGDTLTVTSVTNPPNGSAVISGGGTTVTYTPDCPIVLNDSFGYSISDGQGGTDTGLVTVRNRRSTRPTTSC